MTSELEFRARTVEKAIEEASRQLNIPAEELDYDILSHGSSGVFGLIGIKKAKIIVRKQDPGPDVQNEGSGKQETRRSEESARETERIEKKGDNEGDGEKERVEAVCAEALQNIIQTLDPNATVEKKWVRGTLEMNVLGKDSGLIIGKHGQTLEAIQYLVDKIVNRVMEKRVRVRIDVEGYLANRKKNLKRLATKQAEKAWRTGKAASVGHMNAYDRRVVHMALKEDHRVKTQSIGNGMIRKLLIIPKKQRSREKPSGKSN